MQTSHTHSSPRLWQYVAIFLWKTIWYILVLSCLLVLHEDLWWYWGWKKRISREVFEMQIYSSRFPIRSLEIRGYWKKKNPELMFKVTVFFFFSWSPKSEMSKVDSVLAFITLFSSHIFLIFRSLLIIVRTQSCFLCWLVWTMQYTCLEHWESNEIMFGQKCFSVTF